jgi:hypothetical protein
MVDETAMHRFHMVQSGQPYRDLEKAEGEKWTTEELKRDFDVLAFLAPFVVVRRKADGVNGTMEFTHHPRVYFNFLPDKKEGEP